MAGSNGAPAQRGGPPPHWPAESEEQARALELERWRHQSAHLTQQGYQHPGHANPPAHGYQQPAPGYGQPASYDPALFGHAPQQGDYAPPHVSDANTPVRNPFEPPFGEPAHHQHEQPAPHFERFQPVPAPHDFASAYDPYQQPVGGHQTLQDPFNPHRGPAPYDAHQGFDPGPNVGASQRHLPEPHGNPFDGRGDPQSWDLSNYHPGQIPQGYHGQPAHIDPHAQPEWGSPAHASHDPQWPHLQAGQGQWGPDGPLQHGQHYDPNAPLQHEHFELDPAYQQGDQHHAGEAEGDEYDLPEEPRRGPSTVMVIGMLVGAIVVGGGMALAYRHFGGGGQSVNVAEIKRQTAPEKVRPQNPGGKQIEHKSNAFLNRAGSGGAPAEARQSDVDGSAKKVATIPIVVNRDGSMTPQSTSASVPAPGSSGVPGLLLDGFGPPPAPPELRPGTGPTPTETHAAAQPSRLPPPPPPVERTPPRIADLPLPKVTNAQPPQAVAAVEDPTPLPVRKPAVAPRAERSTHQAAAAASGVGATGLEAPPRKAAQSVSRSGFVAVLASKRSRQEALNTFADLHSQYPDVLGSVTPDVREANLGERGVWYRLIGGPPGSREAAQGICSKLKTRGMKDCWPVAY